MARKAPKPSGQEQVRNYLNALEHPLKEEIEEVRQIILNANDQLSEHIKWNAPSFMIDDEDRVTFNLHGKGFFTLVFHRGAKVKAPVENGPLLDDPTGLLNWVTNDRATIKFTDMPDVIAKKDKLAQVINLWIKQTS